MTNNKIKLLIEDLGLSDNIRFEGQVAHDLLPLYINSSNVFLQ